MQVSEAEKRTYAHSTRPAQFFDPVDCVLELEFRIHSVCPGVVYSEQPFQVTHLCSRWFLQSHCAVLAQMIDRTYLVPFPGDLEVFVILDQAGKAIMT